MSYITTKDNVSLYYKSWGTGRPVVMLHGWPLSADTFDDLAIAVADAGFRAIAYDRRGFGRSEQPWEGYDYDTLSDDLSDVLEQTGATNATLLGFSMGGGEVVRYMSRHGGRDVTQAILVGSVVPYMQKDASNPDGVDPSVFDEMSRGIKDDRAGFWGTFFKQFYGVGVMSHPVTDEVLEWSRVMAMQASLKATLDCAHHFATTDFRPNLSAVTVPTLIIHGTNDKTVPIDASSRRTAALLPHAFSIEYDGGPHGLLASHKQELARDILHFLRTSTVPAETSSEDVEPGPVLI